MIKLWKHTWTYKTYNMIRSYYQYRKDKNLIKDIFYSIDFAAILKKYLNIDLKRDWLGRLYGIINPTINDLGQFDISSTIIEIDGDNTNSNTYVQVWVTKQLEIIRNLFNLQNLYGYIDLSITKVGPINFDNYLLVFDIASRQIFADNFKSWIKQTGIYLFIGALIALGIIFLVI